MNGLEAIELLKNGYRDEYKVAITPAAFDKALSIIEKELKVLEIIRNNNIDVGIFKCMLKSVGVNYTLIRWRDYSDNRLYIGEINLLKEVLKNV